MQRRKKLAVDVTAMSIAAAWATPAAQPTRGP
jgi:hypothetical protein